MVGHSEMVFPSQILLVYYYNFKTKKILTFTLSGAEKFLSTRWLVCMLIRFLTYSCLCCRFVNIKYRYRNLKSSKELV